MAEGIFCDNVRAAERAENDVDILKQGAKPVVHHSDRALVLAPHTTRARVTYQQRGRRAQCGAMPPTVKQLR